MLTQRKPTRSCLSDIEHYFQQPPPLFLDLELAVCWVLDCLLQNDSYPSGLLQRLQSDHPKLRLSETVLHQAVDFLEQQEMLDSYTKRCPSRGRPCRMLHLHQDARGQAERLMEPWSRWLHEHDPLTTSPLTT